MNTMQPLVIYHRSDFDGIFCREIAKRFLPDATFVGLEYGDPLPTVSPDQDLYILDFSVPELMSHPRLVWIDHHATAIAKFASNIRGLRIDGVAACRLAWQWFNGNLNPRKSDFVERTVIEPIAVRLAGEYDIWDRRDPNAELFQHGLRSEDLDWKRMFADQRKDRLDYPVNLYVNTLLQNGTALQYARRKENESLVKAFAFTVQFEELTLLALNTPKCNSLTFLSGLTPEHDGCFAFHWTGKHWRCSLYGVPGKPDVDLSKIAVKFGGGGHKQACGFTCATLPIPL